MIELDYDELTSTAYQLRCTACGDIHNIDSKHRLCSCGKVLFAEYDLEKAKETLVKSSFHKRRYDIWRMAEIMPVFDNKYRFTLGEGWTPIVKINNLGEMVGLKNLYLKDESFNPTGSFKSRGLCAAVSRAVELGINDFVIPTAGNAGAALAAYAARTKSKAHVFMPEDTPPFIVREIKALGADARLVDGIITDAGKIAKEEAEKEDWFDISTLKEPYRVEGNAVKFKASNPSHKGGACYKIYMKVAKWKDSISRRDGRWRDTTRGTVWVKRDYYICPPGDGDSHNYTLTFGLPRRKTGEAYAIMIRVTPGLTYTLRFVY